MDHNNGSNTGDGVWLDEMLPGIRPRLDDTSASRDSPLCKVRCASSSCFSVRSFLYGW